MERVQSSREAEMAQPVHDAFKAFARGAACVAALRLPGRRNLIHFAEKFAGGFAKVVGVGFGGGVGVGDSLVLQVGGPAGDLLGALLREFSETSVRAVDFDPGMLEDLVEGEALGGLLVEHPHDQIGALVAHVRRQRPDPAIPHVLKRAGHIVRILRVLKRVPVFSSGKEECKMQRRADKKRRKSVRIRDSFFPHHFAPSFTIFLVF